MTKIRSIIAAAAVIGAVSQAHAEQRYESVDLHTFSVSTMAPDTTFAMLESSGKPNARWVLRKPDGRIVPLAGPPKDGNIYSISSAGIAGTTPDHSDCRPLSDGYIMCAQHAFVLTHGKGRDLGTLGGRYALLISINSHGDAVGSSELKKAGKCYGGLTLTHAVAFRGRGLEDLGAFGGVCSWAVDINDAGDILIGNFGTDKVERSFVKRGQKTIPIGSLGGAVRSASALNSRGDIVGTSETAAGDMHAFMLRDGHMTDLGALDSVSEATAFNDAGIVVGESRATDGKWRAFVYRDGTMFDLNTLVDWPDSSSHPVLGTAIAIGAHGEILAYVYGLPGEAGHYYLLKPKLGLGASFARAGMVFTYRVSGGTTAASGIGKAAEGDLIYRIVDAKDGAMTWEFTTGGLRGTQSVSANDVASARRVHTALRKGDNSGAATLALPRMSDAVYRDLKAGRATQVSFDGVSDPKSLAPDGSEELLMLINDKPQRVRALRGRGVNGCHVWIADEPGFPLLLKHDCGRPVVVSAAYDPAEVGQTIADSLDRASAASTGTILFAFNSAAIAKESMAVLDALAVYLRGHPALSLAVEGHTDNIGDAAANLKLSQARAEAVRAYLLKSLAPVQVRIIAKGLGLTQPAASNATSEGRSHNRRVVFRPAS